jgi:excisionase family DNA binding protein
LNGAKRLAYSPQEAAELLGCHKNTIHRQIARGDIPAIRIGRRVFVSAPALERMFLQEVAK